METSDAMLFDISPVEDEDSKKKRPSKRGRKKDEPVFLTEPPDYERGYTPGYMASVVGHATCDQCGLSVLDLVEVRKIDGKVQWVVMCGWWCLHSWTIDPIPGLLEREDSRSAAKKFTLRDGRFAGQTFDEVWDSGNEWYIKQVAKGGKTAASKAAAEWLSKKTV